MVMLKLATPALVAALALMAPAGVGAAVLGPDAARCENNGSSVLVRVEGLKTRTGALRVQLYGSNPDDFLAKGRKLRRIDLPVTRAGVMDVCIAVPAPGNYAVAVRHDLDGNGKSGWSDGGGFSRNPRLSLISLKPDYKDVVVAVGRGTLQVRVVMNYRRGLSIGPVSAGA